MKIQIYFGWQSTRQRQTLGRSKIGAPKQNTHFQAIPQDFPLPDGFFVYRKGKPCKSPSASNLKTYLYLRLLIAVLHRSSSAMLAARVTLSTIIRCAVILFASPSTFPNQWPKCSVSFLTNITYPLFAYSLEASSQYDDGWMR